MITIDLSGKVALVTGGSRGLGKAMSLGLALAGADVIVASRKLESCEELCKETVSYTHLRAHETVLDLVCRLLLEKKKNVKS